MRPQLKGHIDRFGGAPDGSIRFMIGPYLPYQAITDLEGVLGCSIIGTSCAETVVGHENRGRVNRPGRTSCQRTGERDPPNGGVLAAVTIGDGHQRERPHEGQEDGQ